MFSAARRAGITNVVWASSETVLGLPFETPPPYVPVDEEYAVRPESTYSLGKAVEEEMARHFTRWDPSLKLIGLRFSNVMDVADYAAFPSFADDPRSRIWNLWGYIDARDGALAVRLALESDLTGFEAFIVASPDTVLERPVRRARRRVLPRRPASAARSRAARRCCPSTRPAACSATTRSTPGATRSDSHPRLRACVQWERRSNDPPWSGRRVANTSSTCLVRRSGSPPRELTTMRQGFPAASGNRCRSSPSRAKET